MKSLGVSLEKDAEMKNPRRNPNEWERSSAHDGHVS